MREQYSPSPGTNPNQPSPSPTLPFRKRKPKMFWALVVLAGLFVVGGISNAVNPPKDAGGSVAVKAVGSASSSTPSPSTADSVAATAGRVQPSASSTAAAKPKAPPPAPTQPAPARSTQRATVKPPTAGQEQALGAAQDYLDTQAFSRAGLIDQLSSSFGSGFSKADANWAVDHLTVNWNEEALRAGKEYLSTQHFS